MNGKLLLKTSAILLIGLFLGSGWIAQAQVRPLSSLVKQESVDDLTVEGTWDFVCCEEAYWGVLELHQNGNIVTGVFSDTNNGTGGDIHGTIEEDRVEFTRTWESNRQFYTLTLSSDGQILDGTFTWDRDTEVGTKFTATLQSQ